MRSRSCRVGWASDCQGKHYDIPGSNPRILQRSGVWGGGKKSSAERITLKTKKDSPLEMLEAEKYLRRWAGREASLDYASVCRGLYANTRIETNLQIEGFWWAHTVTKILNIVPQKWNCAALFPNSTFMHLGAIIYSHDRSYLEFIFSCIAWENSLLNRRNGEKGRELPPSSSWQQFPVLSSVPAVEPRVNINDQLTNFQFGNIRFINGDS